MGMKKILVGSFGKQSLPLYARVEKEIRNKIINGQYEPGEKLPTEDELIKIYGVSKITIRKALSELEADKLIVRNQGRGTFIAGKIPTKEYQLITGDVEGILNSLEGFAVKVLKAKNYRVGETRFAKSVRDFFNINNTDHIGTIEILRTRKKQPVFYFENMLSSDLSKLLLKKDLLKRPLLIILKQKMGMSIGKGELTFEAIPADTIIAKTLKCQPSDPIILFQVFYWLSSGEPLLMINVYMKAENMKYRMNIDVTTIQKI